MKALGYPFCLRTLVRWCSSFRKLFCPVVMVLALSNKHYLLLIPTANIRSGQLTQKVLYSRDRAHKFNLRHINLNAAGVA